jgi:hypothetical protein
VNAFEESALSTSSVSATQRYARFWPHATCRNAVVRSLSGEKQTLCDHRKSVVRDPCCHLATVNCRSAKGSFDHAIRARGARSSFESLTLPLRIRPYAARRPAEPRALRTYFVRGTLPQFGASAATMSACFAVVPWPPTIVASVMLSLRSTSPTETVPGVRPIGPRGEIRSVTYSRLG